MDYVAQRRTLLARKLQEKGFDGLLITNPVNVKYLTGFTGDSSFLLASAKNFILISDNRFEEQLQEECPHIEAHIRPHDKSTIDASCELINKTGLKSVGLESGHATLELFEYMQEKSSKSSFGPAHGLVEALRAVKDPSEVEQIRSAVKVTERAFSMFIAMLRETDTEKEMVDALDGFIRRAGAKGSSFPPIVAVGERGALPHAPPTDRQLLDGSKILVDWGADCGYKADMTRTFRSPYGTAPTRRNKMERVGYNFEELHDIVCKAQDAAVEAVRDGVPAKEVDSAARKVISSSRLRDHGDIKLGDFFTHGLGHGIGLETHEAPRVRANSDDTLTTGMVITIEPGIYLPGWGGVRVEDDFLVTKDGAVRLGTLPREFSLIG